MQAADRARPLRRFMLPIEMLRVQGLRQAQLKVPHRSTHARRHRHRRTDATTHRHTARQTHTHTHTHKHTHTHTHPRTLRLTQTHTHPPTHTPTHVRARTHTHPPAHGGVAGCARRRSRRLGAPTSVSSACSPATPSPPSSRWSSCAAWPCASLRCLKRRRGPGAVARGGWADCELDRKTCGQWGLTRLSSTPKAACSQLRAGLCVVAET